MEDRLAENALDQPPLELSLEVADSVYTLGLDERLPLQALTYVLAHPDASVPEVLKTKPLDHRRAAKWLGEVVVTPEAANTLEEYVKGQASSKSILNLLVEIHTSETPPPPRIEDLMRSAPQDQPLPAILAGIFDEKTPKVGLPQSPPEVVDHSRHLLPVVTATAVAPISLNGFPEYPRHGEDKHKKLANYRASVARYYKIGVDTIRGNTQKDSNESESEFYARYAKVGVGDFLARLEQADDGVKKLFTANVRQFASRVSGRNLHDVARIMSDYAQTAEYVQHCFERYVDLKTAPDSRKQAWRKSPEQLDRLMLTFVGVDTATISREFEVSVGTVSTGNNAIINALSEYQKNDAYDAMFRWNDEYINAHTMSGKATYLERTEDLHRASEQKNRVALYDAIIASPITVGEQTLYEGRPLDLYSKRLADFSELLVDSDLVIVMGFIKNTRAFVEKYVSLDKLRVGGNTTALTNISSHVQANMEIMLSAVVALFENEADDTHRVPQETLDDARKFCLTLFGIDVESSTAETENSEEILFERVAQCLPSIDGLTVDQACYRLRNYGRTILRTRYASSVLINGMQATEGSVTGQIVAPAYHSAPVAARMVKSPIKRLQKRERSTVPPERIFEIARLYAVGTKSADIVRQYELSGQSYVTQCVKRVVTHLENDPESDPDLLASLQQRFAERAQRVAKGSGRLVVPGSVRQVRQSTGDTSRPPLLDDQTERKRYRHHLGWSTVLRPEEEVELCKRIEAGVLAQEKLDNATLDGESLDNLLVRELQWIAEDGKKAKQHMVQANLGLAAKFANSIQSEKLSFDDKVQEATLGIFRAVEMFDYTQGLKFSTYAVGWINRYILRALVEQAPAVELPEYVTTLIAKMGKGQQDLKGVLKREPTNEEVAQHLDISIKKLSRIKVYAQKPIYLDAPIGESGFTQLDALADTAQGSDGQGSAQQRVTEALASVLNESELKIISTRFGLIDGHPRNVAYIGEKYGLSEHLARKALSTALKKLRKDGVGKSITEYLT